MNEDDSKPEDSQEKLNFVIQNIYASIQKKYSKNEAAVALMNTEISKEEADRYVETYYDVLVQQIKSTTITNKDIGTAIFSGFISMIIGALIWSFIAISMKREIGYIALGLGWIIGFVIKMATGGKVGQKMQLIASVISILGIVIAKYFTFFYYVLDSIENKPNGLVDYLILFANFIPYFMENASTMFGFYDILWVVLAVSMAWSSLKEV